MDSQAIWARGPDLPDATINAPAAASITVAAPIPEPVEAAVKLTLPPTTTEQQDITTAGQRQINLIWERTQAFIAIIVVLSTMSVGVKLGFDGKTDGSLPTILSTGFGMVVGFYFSRTNHAAIGGIGAKPNEPYKGR